jgi:hypothetical protein
VTAHRLSNPKQIKIIVMNRGKMQNSTHEELIALQGVYSNSSTCKVWSNHESSFPFLFKTDTSALDKPSHNQLFHFITSRMNWPPSQLLNCKRILHHNGLHLVVRKKLGRK